jgi:DnaK suppressor protein
VTSERLEHFRKLLTELTKEIRDGLNSNTQETAVVELDTAIGRLSRMDAMQNQQMALELKRRQEARLLRVERALKNIENGKFGICGKCREPIAEDRLEVQPDAVMCIRCAG